MALCAVLVLSIASVSTFSNVTVQLVGGNASTGTYSGRLEVWSSSKQT